MIEIRKSHLIIACSVVIVGGATIHLLSKHHTPSRHPQTAGSGTVSGKPVSPSTGTTKTGSTGTGPQAWSQAWNLAGDRAVARHFGKHGLGWLWVVPQGSKGAYLWINPYPTKIGVQYGIESPSGWSFGTYSWPPSVIGPSGNQNPVSLAMGLMTPLIGKSGAQVGLPASVTSSYQNSSNVGLQLYGAQTVEPYALEGIVAQHQSAGSVDVTLVVSSPLPRGLLGPIYYSGVGNVVQDLTFTFRQSGNRWVWAGFSENPVAENRVADQLIAPTEPVG